MTTEEELRATATALEESVAVVGWGETGVDIADRFGGDAADAVVVAADFRSPVETRFPALPSAPLRIGIVSLPERPTAADRSALRRLDDAVDAVVVAPRAAAGNDTLDAAVTTFVGMVRGSGFVNLDLADARTVLGAGGLAVLGEAEGALRSAAETVDDAFGATAAGFELGTADGVLLEIVSGPSLSVDAVDRAISAVRDRVGVEPHLIWGGSIEEALGDQLRAVVVVAGVEDRRFADGDDCPRCGAALSAYSFGDRRTIACDDCGYAGVTVSL